MADVDPHVRLGKGFTVLGTSSLLLLVAALVLIGAVLNSLRQSRKREQQLGSLVASMSATPRTAAGPGPHAVPTLTGLRLTELGAQKVKLREFDLRLDRALDAADPEFVPMDAPSPPRYSVPGIGDVEFHPYQWSQELRAIASRWRRGEAQEPLRTELDRLCAVAEPFTARRDGATYYRYPFPYQVGSKRLEPDWYSGFAQGMILLALVDLYRATGDETFREQARAVFQSFEQPRRQVGQAECWVAFVDDAQYLWFEEYPTADDPQMRVLNGHVCALMGLYAYHRLEPGERSLLLLRAGLTTMQRYAAEYRRPGQSNRYCLTPDDVADYGSQRAVNHQQWLLDVTGEPFFATMRDAFLTDMPMK